MTTTTRFVRGSGALTAIALVVSLLAGGAAASEPDAAGDPDVAFGGDGFVLVASPDPAHPRLESPMTGAPRDNGGVLVAATMAHADRSDWRPLAISIAPDGSYDDSFGDGGIVYPVIPRWSFEDYKISATEAAPLAGGVLVSGSALQTFDGSYRDRLWLQRFTRAGRLDRGFASNGTYRLGSIDLSDRRVSVDDTTILVCGASKRHTKVTVIRLDKEGVAVPGFGTDGRVTIDTEDHGTVESCAVTPSGGVILLQRQPHRFWLTRLTSSGELDSTFGDGGSTQGRLADNQLFHAGVVQRNGRVAIVTSNNNLPIVTRRKANGQPDPAFGGDGYSTLVFPSDIDFADGRAIDIGPGGTVVVGGDQLRWPDDEGFVARLRSDGTMDPAFGEAGIAVFEDVATNFYGVDHYRDGRLLVAGFEDVFPTDTFGRLQG